MNGHFAILQGGEFSLVIVDKDDVVTQVCETSSCNQSNITRTYNSDSHRVFLSELQGNGSFDEQTEPYANDFTNCILPECSLALKNSSNLHVCVRNGNLDRTIG